MADNYRIPLHDPDATSTVGAAWFAIPGTGLLVQHNSPYVETARLMNDGAIELDGGGVVWYVATRETLTAQREEVTILDAEPARR